MPRTRRGTVEPHDPQRVVDRDRAAQQRPRHHRAGTARREDPIDPEPRPTEILGRGGGGEGGIEGASQVVEPAPGDRVAHHHLGVP